MTTSRRVASPAAYNKREIVKEQFRTRILVRPVSAVPGGLKPRRGDSKQNSSW